VADPFLGEIRMMSFVFAPKSWALCNGQLLPIAQNQGLFSLLGTYYGGDGRVNFALPDLRGRVPLHRGGEFSIGQKGGETAHTLTIAELPEHTHVMNASANPGTTTHPVGNVIAANIQNMYANPASLVAMAPGVLTNTGGSQAHQNMQPYLTISYCIALVGIFPSQN